MSEPRRGRARKKWVLSITAASTPLFAAWYLWMVFGPGSQSLDITVQSIDAQTRRPLPWVNLAVYARDYGIMDTSQLVFVGRTDAEGQLKLKTPKVWPISEVIAVAWDKSFEKHGVTARFSYASNLKPGAGFRAAKSKFPSVHFHVNRGLMRVELQEVSKNDRIKYQREYLDALDRSEITQLIVGRGGGEGDAVH